MLRAALASWLGVVICLQAQTPPATQPAVQPLAEPLTLSADQSATPASQPAEGGETEPPEPFLGLGNERITGDWGGWRPKVEAKGITFNVALINIYQQNFKGGLDTHHGHRLTGSADYELTLDTGGMGLWPGGTLYTFAESFWNDAIDDKVGDYFGVNADGSGDEEIRVRQLWYEQKLLKDKIRLKFGKMDMAVDIDTNAYANWEVTQFLNGALINTGNLPLPDYGIGALLGIQPAEWMYMNLDVADAQANGNQTGLNTAFHDEDYFFSALETGFLPVWNAPWGKLPGGYRFILWYDPQPKAKFFNDLGGRRRTVPYKRDDVGFAFNMDQMLYKEVRNNDADTQGLGFFLRYGYAHQDCNDLEHFWSLGAQYQGLIPTRDDDVLAFGFAQGVVSDLESSLHGGDRESVYEWYYNIQVYPWLHVTPDFQYVVHPGMDKNARDAFVAGVRVVMNF